jgi:hypothetical protein
MIETHGERDMLWVSVLVWLAGYKSNGHSPPVGTQLATSLGTTDLHRKLKNNFYSHHGSVKPDSELFGFPLCFCNSFFH